MKTRLIQTVMASGTHVITGDAAIPTLSEWGMIIFMTMILGIGMIMMLRRKESFEKFVHVKGGIFDEY